MGGEMTNKVSQPQVQESIKATAGFLVVASGLYSVPNSWKTITVLIGTLILAHAVFRIFENYSRGIR
jgi:hypothetical protein